MIYGGERKKDDWLKFEEREIVFGKYRIDRGHFRVSLVES